MRLERRSERYMNAIRQLDSGVHGAEVDEQAIAEIIGAEFPDFGEFLPLGFIGQCFLGPPFEVHTVNRTGSSIIDHYPVGQALPGGLERARRLALHPGYAFLEVYEDRVVAITIDGSTVDLDK
jgi:hypothetical protein